MPGLGLRRCPAMEHAEQPGESADGECKVKQCSFLHVGDSPLAMSFPLFSFANQVCESYSPKDALVKLIASISSIGVLVYRSVEI
jgi:hypothetical protein